MHDYDNDRVRQTGRDAARKDHGRGRSRPISRFWAPEYREGYEDELRELETAHRQPAGVNPGELATRETVPEAADTLDAIAGEIGRRAALKILARHTDDPDPVAAEVMAGIIEGEIRSTWGTPREGDVTLRFGYAEAVTAVTAIVEARSEGRSAAELDTLHELRRKFLLAIGLL